ncbi:hypothetical protein BS78_07G032400 [Paspalum vaginatum]|nr:hypothetical protein BS78_07G032400 [Paspalum vaginatum]
MHSGSRPSPFLSRVVDGNRGHSPAQPIVHESRLAPIAVGRTHPNLDRPQRLRIGRGERSKASASAGGGRKAGADEEVAVWRRCRRTGGFEEGAASEEEPVLQGAVRGYTIAGAAVLPSGRDGC